MTQPPPMGVNPGMSKLFELEYPQSIGVYSSYAEAQKVVDYLSDQHFPVSNIAIVGTDLRLVERVTGRRTWGTVLLAGVQSGLSTGMIITLVMWVLNPANNFFATAFLALSIGVVIGVLFSVLGYAMSQGRRDFTSVTQTVATKYEVLCEHKVVGQARQVLDGMPGPGWPTSIPRAGSSTPVPAPAVPAPTVRAVLSAAHAARSPVPPPVPTAALLPPAADATTDPTADAAPVVTPEEPPQETTNPPDEKPSEG